LLDKTDRKKGDVDSDPLAPQLLRGVDGGATATERVEHNIAFV
jgi:hypothetical protein